MSLNFLDKLKFLVKTESFQRRPIKTIYRCFIILIYYILKVETKYQVNIKFSKFFIHSSLIKKVDLVVAGNLF